MAYKKSTAPEYYKLSSHPGNENLTIKKFDEELDCTSIYHMIFIESKDGGYYDCQCPASKFDCRHKGIMKTIKDAEMINSSKFYCHQAPTAKPELQGKFLDATEIV
jgi:hypothetical protein